MGPTSNGINPRAATETPAMSARMVTSSRPAARSRPRRASCRCSYAWPEHSSTSVTGRDPVVSSPCGTVSPHRAAVAAMWVSNSAARVCVLQLVVDIKKTEI
eukprot:1227763-Prymnesium_polylepis.1